MKVWECKIGPAMAAELPPGADRQMREAVKNAFRRMTGREPDATFSGWGGEFNPSEKAVVWNKAPDFDEVVAFEVSRLRERGLLDAVRGYDRGGSSVAIEREIAAVLNRHCAENGSNTPDWLLAQFLLSSLAAFNDVMQKRVEFYGRDTHRSDLCEPDQ